MMVAICKDVSQFVVMLSYSTPLFVMASLWLAFTQDVRPDVSVLEPVTAQSTTEQVFGFSEAGREIVGYEIGNGDTCLLFFGGIHGNERGTVELMETFAHELGLHPELVPADKKIVVIPLVNPDGYSDRQDKLNANGVNLNRNFVTDDWLVQEGDEDTYAGEQPFSEVESKVLREVVNTCDPEMMIAFHSQGALVSPELNRSSIQLAKWYAAHTGYAYFDEWDYAGTATRWFVETTDQAAITVELTTHTESDWELNRSALLEILSK
jgi:predicted deacylase